MQKWVLCLVCFCF